MEIQDLNVDTNARFGTLAMARGREDGLSLFEWAPVPDCTNKDCPLDKRCPFTRRDGKCKVISGIIKAASNNILNNYGLKLNNAQKNRIGQHLIPLYGNLARMFIVETSLSSPQFIDKHGSPKMNPVYKDIRETIRGIELLWKQIGLVDMPIGEAEIGNYYDQMEAEAMEEMKENKPNKPKTKVKLKKRKTRI